MGGDMDDVILVIQLHISAHAFYDSLLSQQVYGLVFQLLSTIRLPEKIVSFVIE